MSQGLSDMFITSFSQTEGLTVVERSRVSELMTEMKFSLSGIVDEKSAVELGKLLGASRVVLGSFMKLGSEIRIDARLVDVEKGSIVPGASRGATATSLEQIDNVVDEISSSMAAKFGVANSTMLGDASLKAQLIVTFSPETKGALTPAVDGVPYIYTEDGIMSFVVPQGKHLVEIVKGMFRPKTLLDQYLELPGGYITRVRYDLPSNTLEVYDSSPSDLLIAKRNGTPLKEEEKSPVKKDTTSETVTVDMKTGVLSVEVVTSEGTDSSASELTESTGTTLTKSKEPAKIEAITDSRYVALKSQMLEESFDDRRIGIMKSAMKNRYFTCEQLTGIINCIIFESNKVEAAKFGYERLVDKDDFYTIFQIFRSPFVRDDLREWYDQQS